MDRRPMLKLVYTSAHVIKGSAEVERYFGIIIQAPLVPLDIQRVKIRDL